MIDFAEKYFRGRGAFLIFPAAWIIATKKRQNSIIRARNEWPDNRMDSGYDDREKEIYEY